jgi:hypothetical protein
MENYFIGVTHTNPWRILKHKEITNTLETTGMKQKKQLNYEQFKKQRNIKSSY